MGIDKMINTFKEDLMYSYLVLQEMHDTLEKFEPFKDDLTERGEVAINNLNGWNVEDPELKSFVDDTINLLKGQIDISNKIKKRRESIIKQDKEDYFKAKNINKNTAGIP